MAATRRRPFLLPSPHHDDVFLVSGNDLRLYELDTSGEAGSGVATLLHVNMEAHSRCVTWCPLRAQPFQLAVGTSSGKVVLHDCTPSSVPAYLPSGVNAGERAFREFVPSLTQRACNAVDWNKQHTNWIVAGLDRARSGSCVLVWDVERDRELVSSIRASTLPAPPIAPIPRAASCAVLPPSSHELQAHAMMSRRESGSGGAMIRPNLSESFFVGAGMRFGGSALPAGGLGASGVPAEQQQRELRDARECGLEGITSFKLSEAGAVDCVSEPLAEFSNSEGVVSVAWMAQYPKCLLVGTGYKWLRLYDVRGPLHSAVAMCIAHNKAVLGLEFSPHHAHLVATYSDDGLGLVKVWDVRRLDGNEPAFSVQLPNSAPSSRSQRGDNVASIAWCPTRHGCLATALERSNDLHVWTLSHLIARANVLSCDADEPPGEEPHLQGSSAGGAGGGGGGGGSGHQAGSGSIGSSPSVAAGLGSIPRVWSSSCVNLAAGGAAGLACGAAAGAGGTAGGAGGAGVGSGNGAGELLMRSPRRCAAMSESEVRLAPLPQGGGSWPVLTQATRTVSGNEPVSAMCWHRSLEAHLLLLTQRDSAIALLPVHTAKPIAWSPVHSSLAAVVSGHVHVCSTTAPASQSGGQSGSPEHRGPRRERAHRVGSHASFCESVRGCAEQRAAEGECGGFCAAAQPGMAGCAHRGLHGLGAGCATPRTSLGTNRSAASAAHNAASAHAAPDASAVGFAAEELFAHLSALGRFPDISERMFLRARAGYGLDTALNVQIVDAEVRAFAGLSNGGGGGALPSAQGSAPERASAAHRAGGALHGAQTGGTAPDGGAFGAGGGGGLAAGSGGGSGGAVSSQGGTPRRQSELQELASLWRALHLMRTSQLSELWATGGGGASSRGYPPNSHSQGSSSSHARPATRPAGSAGGSAAPGERDSGCGCGSHAGAGAQLTHGAAFQTGLLLLLRNSTEVAVPTDEPLPLPARLLLVSGHASRGEERSFGSTSSSSPPRSSCTTQAPNSPPSSQRLPGPSPPSSPGLLFRMRLSASGGGVGPGAAAVRQGQQPPPIALGVSTAGGARAAAALASCDDSGGQRAAQAQAQAGREARGAQGGVAGLAALSSADRGTSGEGLGGRPAIVLDLADARGWALGLFFHSSEARRTVSSLCGWPLASSSEELATLVRTAEAQSEFERAAVLAFLHGDLEGCVHTLRTGGDVLDAQAAAEADAGLSGNGRADAAGLPPQGRARGGWHGAGGGQGAGGGGPGGWSGADGSPAGHGGGDSSACSELSRAERSAQLRLVAMVLAWHPRSAAAQSGWPSPGLEAAASSPVQAGSGPGPQALPSATLARACNAGGGAGGGGGKCAKAGCCGAHSLAGSSERGSGGPLERQPSQEKVAGTAASAGALSGASTFSLPTALLGGAAGPAGGGPGPGGSLAAAIALGHETCAGRGGSEGEGCGAAAGRRGPGLGASSPTHSLPLWESTVKQLHWRVHSAHLRLILALLGGSALSPSAVLREALCAEAGISVNDALAFACRLAPLADLTAMVAQRQEALAARGELAGLLLTGLATPAGAQLLQVYVDRTADVQTAALWLESYKDLLDRWRLWHERATLECDLRELGCGPLVVKPDLLVRCAFCSREVGGMFATNPHGSAAAAAARAADPRAHAQQRQAGMRAGVGTARPGGGRAMACPHCAKPLPRCAICLLHLGEGLSRQPGADGSGAFDEWFAWCQSCHHGGHASHLTEWFATHAECPVSNCTCRCAQLDPAAAM